MSDLHLFVYARNGYAKRIMKAISNAKTVHERDKVLMPLTDFPVAFPVMLVKDGKHKPYFRPGLGSNIGIYRAMPGDDKKPLFKTKAKALKEAESIAEEIRSQYNARVNARNELIQRQKILDSNNETLLKELIAAESANDLATADKKRMMIGANNLEIDFIKKSLAS